MSELATFLTNEADVEHDVQPGQPTRRDASGGIDRRDRYKIVVDPTLGPLTGLLCRVRPIDARTQKLYGQRNIQVSHRVYFDQVYPVARGQRLKIDGGAQILLVEGIFDTDLLGRVFVVDCQEQLD